MTAEPDALAERVRCFVAEAAGVRVDRVGLETRLSEDLGIDGGDASDVLNTFAERFGVDLSELRFDWHFSPEGLPIETGFFLFLGAVGLMLLWVWVWWAALLAIPVIVAVWRRQASNPYALRVRHLVTAAEMGRWDSDAAGLPEVSD